MEYSPIVRGHLEHVLGSKTKIAAVRLLCAYRKGFTGREIARSIGRNPMTVHQALRQLEVLGVVEAERVGRAKVFRLANDNPWVREVLVPLFEAEARVGAALREEILQAISGQAVSAVLFGSRARGESRAGSDVDLLIVLAPGADAGAVRQAVLEVGLRYGLSIEAICVNVQDLQEWARQASELWEGIQRDGLVIAGADMHELRRHVSEGISHTG